MRVLALLLTMFAIAGSANAANLSATPHRALYDQPVRITVTDLQPGARVTLALQTLDAHKVPWRSSATFVADAAGRVDLSRAAPVKGDYRSAHAMGLFWSMKPMDGKQHPFADPAMREPKDGKPGPIDYVLTACAGKQRIGKVTLTRLMIAPDVAVTRIRDPHFVANLFVPGHILHDGKRHAAMIALGGAEGGTEGGDAFARWLSSHGFVVLSVAWYHEQGLNNDLVDVPVDRIAGKALDYLGGLRYVDPDRIGMIGGSWGGTFAMAAAANLPRIHAVVSWVGSVTPFTGLARDRRTQGFRPVDEAPFTIGGQPVPYASFQQVSDFLKHGDADAVTGAATPVWRVHGPVLLVAGTDDTLGTSGPMARLAMDLLEKHKHGYPDKSLVYAEAGHLIWPGYRPTAYRNQRIAGIPPVGGSAQGYARADADSSARTLAFLDAALGHSSR